MLNRPTLAFFTGLVLGLVIKFPETYGPTILNSALIIGFLGFLFQWTTRKSDQSFALGASSHISNVTFDKYIVFAEEYYNNLLKIRQDLLQNGSSVKAFDNGIELRLIRLKYALWISNDIAQKLISLEDELLKIGAKERYL